MFEKVIALAQDYALGDIFTYGAASHTLALAYQEPREEALERAKQSIESLRAKGLILSMTSYLAVLGELFWMAGRFAEGLDAISDALAVVERTGERCWEAEIWRIKGELADSGHHQPSGRSRELLSEGDRDRASDRVQNHSSCAR